jgi:hypothetical protein
VPKEASNDAIAIMRRWAMLRKLPAQGVDVTASEVVSILAQEGYKVVKRTAERDLESLNLMFPVRRNEKHKPYGWFCAKDG